MQTLLFQSLAPWLRAALRASGAMNAAQILRKRMGGTTFHRFDSDRQRERITRQLRRGMLDFSASYPK